MTPWSKVTQIVASHFDDEHRLRFGQPLPHRRSEALHLPHARRRQALATDLDGLPGNEPVEHRARRSGAQGICFSPAQKHRVWVSFDDGDHWQSLQFNLPHTSMRDLWIHDNDLARRHPRPRLLDSGRHHAAAATSDAIAKSDAHLFKPAPAYRYRRDTNTDTPLPPEVPAGKIRPTARSLTIIWAADLQETWRSRFSITLESSCGAIASTDQPPYTLEEQSKSQIIPTYWIQVPKILAGESGMHRWVWNLHYATPETLGHGYPIAAVPHDTPLYPLGPRALPGVYTVKLTANDHTYSQMLTVKEDPRVHVTPACAGRAICDGAAARFRDGSQLRRASASQKIPRRLEAAGRGRSSRPASSSSRRRWRTRRIRRTRKRRRHFRGNEFRIRATLRANRRCRCRAHGCAGSRRARSRREARLHAHKVETDAGEISREVEASGKKLPQPAGQSTQAD